MDNNCYNSALTSITDELVVLAPKLMSHPAFNKANSKYIQFIEKWLADSFKVDEQKLRGVP